MNHLGVKTRVLIFTLVPAFIIAALLTGYYTLSRIGELDQSLLERGAAIVRQLSPASEYGVFSGKRDFLQALANAAVEERDVRSVVFTDSDGRVLARSGPSFRPHESPWRRAEKTPKQGQHKPGTLTEFSAFPLSVPSHDGRSIIFYGPILQREVIIDELGDFSAFDILGDSGSDETQKQIGWVSVELSRTSTLLEKNKALSNGLLLTLLVLAASAVVGVRMVRRVTDPIVRLTAAVERLEKDDLSTRVEETSGGELGTLEKGFNMMATTMQSAREDLHEQIEQATLELRETLNTVELQNAQLALAKKEALAASNVKSEFLASMSHEIRTPLNGILGYANLIMKTKLDGEQREYADTIKRSGETLLRIVNDILDFSKIESGKLELESVDIVLRDCVEDVLDLIAPNALEKGLELVYLIYSDLPPVVRGDPVRLRQVLVNLVSNGVKFTNAGSVVVRVMREDETRTHIVLRFSVSDTGIGLSEQDQRRLFRAFSQAEKNIGRKISGTGLGLVISKKLVERMHGQVSLDSEQGKGTTVSFTVRCEKSDSKTSRAQEARFQGSTALLYDAHPIMRLALLENLSRWGLEVTDASDPVKLAEIVQNGSIFDIAVLGLPMDDKNIGQALELVETVVLTCSCPILVLANTTEPSHLNHLTSMGVSATISKPVRSSRLQRQVEELLTGQPQSARSPVNMRQSPKTGVNLKGVRILVAEDNEVSRRLVAYLLENQSAEVAVAVNGRQAVERMAEKNFDIVLMDVHMPEMDGATVTAMLRAAERGLRHTPVVALTADAIEGNRERFLEAGMDDYLSKPIDEQALYLMVEKWVSADKQDDGPMPLTTEPPAEQEAPLGRVVLDWSQALKATGGREELAGELLSMLIEETMEYRDKLEAAVNDHALDTLSSLAHTLAGGAAHCGATALWESAKRLEHAASVGQDTLVSQALDRLYLEMERLRDAVAKKDIVA